MADLETLKTRLTEAQQARHALAMGERVVDVWRNGQRVRYQEADGGKLDAYIAELEAGIDGIENSRLPRRRFMPVAFR